MVTDPCVFKVHRRATSVLNYGGFPLYGFSYFVIIQTTNKESLGNRCLHNQLAYAMGR